MKSIYSNSQGNEDQELAVRMFYFGVWRDSGHFLVHENGVSVRDSERGTFPWNEWGGEIDGKLQPHRSGCKQQAYCGCTNDPEGVAALHHKNGWTALSFWDRSLDGRGGCNSNYFAEGTFSFDDMVEMSKTRFKTRWDKMTFPVTLSERNQPNREDQP